MKIIISIITLTILSFAEQLLDFDIPQEELNKRIDRMKKDAEREAKKNCTIHNLGEYLTRDQKQHIGIPLYYNIEYCKRGIVMHILREGNPTHNKGERLCKQEEMGKLLKHEFRISKDKKQKSIHYTCEKTEIIIPVKGWE